MVHDLNPKNQHITIFSQNPKAAFLRTGVQNGLKYVLPR